MMHGLGFKEREDDSMGIADIFGFGKKGTKGSKGKKEPFRAPAEVAALRIRIAAEERENYPSFAHFQELQEEAAVIYNALDAIIAQDEYAEDAVRLREDIRRKMSALEARIMDNMRRAKEEASRDLIESSPDDPARKEMWTSARTLFAEFLEAHELLIKAGAEARPGRGEQIHSASAPVLRTLTELHDKFFSTYGYDREIREMRDTVVKKIAELNSLFARAMASTQDYAVRVSLAADVQRLSAMAAKISSI